MQGKYNIRRNMRFNINRTRTKNAQSILEYLIVLSAIIVAIVINTVGFNAGVQNSLGLQNSLNTTQEDVSTILNSPKPPTKVVSEPYYVPRQTKTSDPNNRPKPRLQYNGGYHYNDWVNSNPDNGYINHTGGNSAPKPGTGNNGPRR